MIALEPLFKSALDKFSFAALPALLLGSVCFVSSPLHAQEVPQPQRAALPAGVPVLPEPKEKEQVKLLSKNNLGSFESLLIEPLKYWIKEGKVVLRLLNGLNFAWTYGADFEAESRRNLSRYALSQDGSLRLREAEKPAEVENQTSNTVDSAKNGKTSSAAEGLPYPQAFPFGLAIDLEAESSPLAKAQKIIWNSAVAQTRVAEGGDKNSLRFERSSYQFELSWFSDSTLLRSAKGVYYRRAPGPQVWREDALRFFSPGILAGHSFLSQRSLDSTEDRFFIFSAVTRKPRPALAANRGDALLGAGISFDELFGLAIKPQAVGARLIEQRVMLLPFPGVNPWLWSIEKGVGDRAANAVDKAGSASALPPAAQASDKSSSVFTVSGDLDAQDSSSSGKKSLVSWNYQTQQLPQFAPWLPTSVVFVPRKVWLLELAPLDPYYANGKELLVIDQESMLPFYRIVFDRLGEHRRTVICSWNLARLKDGTFARALPAFVMSVDANAEKAQVLQLEKMQLFYAKGGKSLPAQNQAVKDFDANFNTDKFKIAERKTQGAKPAANSTPEEDLRD